jgi:hypothetical protein
MYEKVRVVEKSASRSDVVDPKRWIRSYMRGIYSHAVAREV